MHLIDPAKHSRRAFLRRGGQLALAGTALPFAMNLAAIGEAAAQSAGDDYKALVCVFLYGGCDYANTVVTYDDPSHAAYSTIRVPQASGGIAIAKSDLAATALVPDVALPNGRAYALHPSMGRLASVFGSGRLAVQLNVGPLVAPLTRAGYASGDRTRWPVPPKLFSHNDQQSTWQSSSPEGSTVGWGGHAGDLMLAQNAQSLFTCISLAGNAVFLSGDTALQYQVSTGGAVGINSIKGSTVYGSSSVHAAITQLAQQTSAHRLEDEYARITRRAVGAEATVTSAIQMATAFSPDPFAGNTTYIANQLKMVARLIRGRATLGAKRQVFFVSLGGFDLHDKLIANQAVNLTQLSDAMAAFDATMVQLGVSEKVTTFTASDFGRTLASNGDGADHGWGGHHLVMGGAVRGRRIYGTPQVVSLNDDARLAGYEGHVGQGRLIPSTSVDQYAATLARWFGVSESNLPTVLPNLRNFGGSLNGIDYPTNVGFMG